MGDPAPETLNILKKLIKDLRRLVFFFYFLGLKGKKVIIPLFFTGVHVTPLLLEGVMGPLPWHVLCGMIKRLNMFMMKLVLCVRSYACEFMYLYLPLSKSSREV